MHTEPERHAAPDGNGATLATQAGRLVVDGGAGATMVSDDTPGTTGSEPAPATATPIEERAKRRKRKGLIIVNTGNGKGKTTAALGVALRAVGSKKRVLFLQFVKGDWKTGEMKSCLRLAPELEFVRMGKGFTIPGYIRRSMDEHEHAAAEALEAARQVMSQDRYDIIIFDEILYAIRNGLTTTRQVLDVLDLKPPMLHVILTGRDAPPEIIERADLVTEMRQIKHPLREQGIMAQQGIEF